MLFDKHNNSLIICDFWNKRIMRWFYQNEMKPQILFTNVECQNVAMDKNGFFYISDYHIVKQWKEGDKFGQIVAGGNGEGSHLNQIDFSTSIFIDNDSSLYIAEYRNHRVTKWRKDARQGIVVAGGNKAGNSLHQLFGPLGVIVDHLGQIYVADSVNNRIMRWREGEKQGEIIVGGNGEGIESNQLNGPTGLSFDVDNNLYVVDSRNHRVQKYLIDVCIKMFFV